MKIEKLTILIWTVLILGCGEKENNSVQLKAENQINKELSQIDSIADKKEINSIVEETELTTIENIVRLKFNEFIIEIDSLEVWDEERNLKQVHKDTARVYLELGETIEAQTLRILNQKEGKIKLFQRFENSVTVMNEGPHCDLTKWKHYNSEWKELKIKNGEFTTDSYSEKDWKKFIEVDMNELRKAVKIQCGERWAEHIKEVKSPTEYPFGVSMSRIFLRIDYHTQEDVLVKERIISFEIPMGC